MQKKIICFLSCLSLFFAIHAKAVEDEYEAISLLGKKLYSPPPGQAELARYEEARADFRRDPSEENFIWYGRRLAYIGKYKEAISVFTQGIKKFPASYRLYRHLGHRHITLRCFDDAIADFNTAARLVAGRVLEIEPDGIPNRIQKPLSNTQFNIFYHLGLAYYLKRDFPRAIKAYRECLRWCNNDDLTVAASDWLYMSWRRLGDEAEARKVLERISERMTVVENQAYHNRLLMYMGKKTPESLLTSGGDAKDAGLDLITQAYGVGNWYYCQGDKKRAQEIFAKILMEKNWAAFGYIAAEADLAAAARPQDSPVGFFWAVVYNGKANGGIDPIKQERGCHENEN